MIKLLYPYLLLLILAPVILRALMVPVKGLHGDALRIPFLKDIKNISAKAGDAASFAKGFSKKIIWLYLVWGLLCLALARPQHLGEPMRLKNYGRDILMVMDISTSMLERDFVLNSNRITRLTAVKQAAQRFIEKRTEDRIGLVLFGSRAYMQAPITFDKNSVIEIMNAMDAGMAGSSTAIFDALGLALKYINNSPATDKKIIVLLTDGDNNSGILTMPQVIKSAKDSEVKIYAIGVGVVEQSLQQIAESTGGRYFNATGTADLMNIYAEINKLEPSEKDVSYAQETTELFYIPLLAAIFMALMAAVFVRRAND